ncbi:MAG: tripartite tricarboxylate transporter permease [Nanoarchaeota archaeon]|nr:tripartite tricarboxylate transporter permease [Nanoarchaeota archaeon]
MFVEILLAILAGVASGIFTGLTPGIHINLVSLLLLSSSPALSKFLPLEALACFVIAMGITHTFLDVLPSIFLGAPDESEALGVLPGHRFLLKGEGMDAVKLSVIGAFFGLLLSILLAPLLFFAIKYGYSHVQNYIPHILIAASMYMILRDRTKWWAVLVFFMSGMLGMIVFSMETLNDPLFPMLSGLFGVSTLLISLKDKNNIPEQKPSKLKIGKMKLIKALLSGNLSAFITSTMPGLSSSIAATMSLQVTRKLHDDGFLILLGAIGTAGFSLSLVTLAAIGKARNGAIIVVQKLVGEVVPGHFLFFLCACLIAGSISLMLSIYLGRGFAKFITKVNYQVVCWSVIGFIVLLVILITGWIGLLVLLTSTALGIIPGIVKCTRTQAMGCLILPVLAFFVI